MGGVGAVECGRQLRTARGEGSAGAHRGNSDGGMLAEKISDFWEVLT
jgi:hypothetical protein